MDREIFELQVCQEQFFQALFTALQANRRRLLALSRRRKIDGISFDVCREDAELGIGFKQRSESCYSGDHAAWEYQNLINCQNTPSLCSMRDQVREYQSEQGAAKFGLSISEVQYLLRMAAALALSDIRIVEFLNSIGIPAYRVGSGLNPYGFLYVVGDTNPFGSSSDFLDYARIAINLDRVTRGPQSHFSIHLDPWPWRWGRPPLEHLSDRYSLSTHRGKDANELPVTFYVDDRNDGRLFFWYPEPGLPNPDEMYYIDRFYRASCWCAWKTREELKQLLIEPGSYVLRRVTTGTLSGIRWYLRPDASYDDVRRWIINNEQYEDDDEYLFEIDPQDAQIFELPAQREQFETMAWELTQLELAGKNESKTESVTEAQAEPSSDQAEANPASPTQSAEPDPPFLYWEPVLLNTAIEQHQVWEDFAGEEMPEYDEFPKLEKKPKEEEPENEDAATEDPTAEDTKPTTAVEPPSARYLFWRNQTQALYKKLSTLEKSLILLTIILTGLILFLLLR